MAFLRRKVQEKEFGFGKTDARQKRLINPDGTYNFKRIGIPLYKTLNVYHFLVSASLWRFMLWIFIWYTAINGFFVALYYLTGVENLGGMVYNNTTEKFWEVYFFSAQTLTTVGYGRINPMGFSAGLIATIEALVGLLTFAIITGLLFARFSKAPSILMFSEKAVIAPYIQNDQTITAFIFRTANLYNTNLMNMKAQITLSLLEKNSEGLAVRKFYGINLERDTIIFFPSSWTIVHPIDQSSPLFGLDEKAFQEAKPEFMILMNGFDETFDQDIFIRYSYSYEEIEWGARFTKILDFDTEGMATVDLGRLNHFTKEEINHLIGTSSLLDS